MLVQGAASELLAVFLMAARMRHGEYLCSSRACDLGSVLNYTVYAWQRMASGGKHIFVLRRLQNKNVLFIFPTEALTLSLVPLAVLLLAK